MKPKHIYLLLCLLGVILPYWQLLPWLLEHGFHVSLLVQQLFANRISAFFGMDVIVSAAVVVVFMRVESSRSGVRRRSLPLLALITVGVSLALPLYLYLRELKLEQDSTVMSN